MGPRRPPAALVLALAGRVVSAVQISAVGHASALALILASQDALAAFTSPTQITAIFPESVTVNDLSSVTLVGSLTEGDKFTFAVDCSLVTPLAGVSVGSTYTAMVQFSVVENYTLCYDFNGIGESVEQTGIILEVVEATPATRVIGVSPSVLTAGVSTPVALTLDGWTAGDKVAFLTDCTGATPSTEVTFLGDQAIVYVTIASAGTVRVCYRDSKGTDSVAQTSVSLTVLTATFGSGNDPVVIYGGERKMIWLPIGIPHLLLRIGALSVFATTFAGSVYEQWYDRFAICFGSKEIVRVGIRPDILGFNRTVAAPGTPETLDVRLGGDTSVAMPAAGGFVKATSSEAPVSVYLARMNRRVRSSMIGKACRELIQVVAPSVNLLIWSSPADEYYGDQADLAVKYAHLDLEVLELDSPGSSTGILPEVVGFRQASPQTAALIKANLPVMGAAHRLPLSVV